MRRVAVIGLFALTLAAAVVVSEPSSLGGLPLPPQGQVQAERLDDGTPVFVVHDEDGTVRVLGATHPFQRIDAAVVWCPPARRFVGVFTATRYDTEGEWLGGPAPHGLPRWEARRNGDRVIVGSPLPPAPRDDDSPDDTFSDTRCWSPGTPGDVDPAVVLRHEFRSGTRPVIDELRHSDAAGTHVIFGSMLELPDGEVRFCDTVHPGPPPRCNEPGLSLPSTGEGSGMWHALLGWFRVRVAGGVVREAELLELSAYGPFHDPAYDPARLENLLPDPPSFSGGVLTVPAVDIAFLGDALQVPEPVSAVELRNHGRLPHGLRMEQPESWQIQAAAGQTARIDGLRLAEGSYTLYCPVPGHREAGMEFTLRVG